MFQRIAIVTGAANGIGRATTALLIEQGFNVFCVDQDAATLSKVAQAYTDRVETFVADVADKSDQHDYTAACLARFGRIDVSFLNAGILGPTTALTEYSIEDFDRVMAVNVRGVWLGTTRALKVMQSQRSGSIVITSSTGGLRGSGGLGAYVASKHAVVGIMKTAAIEGGAYGVRVNAIHPGPTATQVWQAASPTKTGGTVETGLPQLYRVADPSEIAEVVAFLASDKSSFCTGASFTVDGGLLAGPAFTIDGQAS